VAHNITVTVMRKCRTSPSSSTPPIEGGKRELKLNRVGVDGLSGNSMRVYTASLDRLKPRLLNIFLILTIGNWKRKL